jgi:hypothetical protein
VAHGPAWQLTKAALEKVRVNMSLHYPCSVFTRRENVALDQATIFELMLTLKGCGWHEESEAGIKKKKSLPPFTAGHSDRS